MADRTAAEIFGTLFQELVKHKKEPWVKRLAKRMWEYSDGFDFSPCQLECDAALIGLGLAKKGIDPAYPEDGEGMLYKGQDY